MFSVCCTEMGESGFAPTRQITNRFLVYMWKMYKAHFFDHVVVGALPATPEKWKTNKKGIMTDVAGYVPTEKQ